MSGEKESNNNFLFFIFLKRNKLPCICKAKVSVLVLMRQTIPTFQAQEAIAKLVSIFSWSTVTIENVIRIINQIFTYEN